MTRRIAMVVMVTRMAARSWLVPAALLMCPLQALTAELVFVSYVAGPEGRDVLSVYDDGSVYRLRTPLGMPRVTSAEHEIQLTCLDEKHELKLRYLTHYDFAQYRPAEAVLKVNPADVQKYARTFADHPVEFEIRQLTRMDASTGCHYLVRKSSHEFFTELDLVGFSSVLWWFEPKREDQRQASSWLRKVGRDAESLSPRQR